MQVDSSGIVRSQAIAVGATLLLAILAIVPAAAQGTFPQLETIEVTEPLHASLVLLQEQWLEWLTAYHERDPEQAAQVLDDISATMSHLGVERLGDMSFGAIVSAVQAARASDFERAAWSLQAAEHLDPGRPEISFAAATIERLKGRRLASIGQQLDGYFRLWSFRWERMIFSQDIQLWILFILVLSSASFVLLLAHSYGGRFYQDLVAVLGRRLPDLPAKIVALGLMLFPLVLPNGLLWLLVFWGIAFWGYCSRSERVVLVGIWLLLVVVPELVTEQRRRMTIHMTAAVRAMENHVLARLDGSALTDLGELRLALPESMAVKQLLADSHQDLGQWEFGRALYLDIVDGEPTNGEAMLNLGAFYFQVGDYASAIQLFQRASATDEVAAAAYFNLSQAYSVSYLFDESSVALRTARQLDRDATSSWINHSEEERVVTVAGGVRRREEILTELEGALLSAGEKSSLLVRLAYSEALRMALLVGLVAMAFTYMARRRGFYHQNSEQTDPGDGGDRQGSLAEVLVPGVAATHQHDGYRAFLALVVPTSLLTLPLINKLGYRIPWGYEPGVFVMWAIAGLGLLIYFSHRVFRGLTS